VDEQVFPQQIDPEIMRLTRFKSRQLAGRYGFLRHDAEDIQQDLLLDYLKRSRSFDAHRCSRRTFARLVVNNRIATILEARKAACRDHRVCRLSLNEPVDADDSPELAEILAVVIDSCRGRGRSFEAMLNLRLDVKRALARLPTAQAHLCRLLMVCDTCAEAAARAGMSRATLYRRIHAVQAAFRDAGLDESRRRPIRLRAAEMRVCEAPA
jgi:RNA polymerase sigma factor (sigma-70 family)